MAESIKNTEPTITQETADEASQVQWIGGEVTDLFGHNTLIFGGKNAIRPVFEYAISVKNKEGNYCGAFCMDVKGVLWRDLQASAEKVGRSDDVILIGSNDNLPGIDPLKNLTPNDLHGVLRAFIASGDKLRDKSDGFWLGMAVDTLFVHVASLVYASSMMEKPIYTGRYSLQSIFRLITEEKMLTETINAFSNLRLQDLYFSSGFDQINELAHAMRFFNNEWMIMHDDTAKTRMIEALAKVLESIGANPALIGKFSVENRNQEYFPKFLDGKLVMLSMPEAEHNDAAKLLSLLIKASAYKAGIYRERTMGWAHCKAHPVLVVVDEAHEFVTTGCNSLADSEFWRRARTAGFSGLFATPSREVCTAAVGCKEKADAFLGNMSIVGVELPKLSPSNHTLH